MVYRFSHNWRFTTCAVRWDRVFFFFLFFFLRVSFRQRVISDRIELLRMRVWRMIKNLKSHNTNVPFVMAWLNLSYKMSRSTTNQNNDTCSPQKRRSVCESAQSDQGLRCALNGQLYTPDFFMRTAKTLIRLGGCPGWSESSLGAQVILLFLFFFCFFSCSGPNIVNVTFALLAEMESQWESDIFIDKRLIGHSRDQFSMRQLINISKALSSVY